MRRLLVCICSLLILSPGVFADSGIDSGDEILMLKQQVKELRSQFDEMKAYYGSKIDKMQQRIRKEEADNRQST